MHTSRRTLLGLSMSLLPACCRSMLSKGPTWTFRSRKDSPGRIRMRRSFKTQRPTRYAEITAVSRLGLLKWKLECSSPEMRTSQVYRLLIDQGQRSHWIGRNLQARLFSTVGRCPSLSATTMPSPDAMLLDSTLHTRSLSKIS